MLCSARAQKSADRLNQLRQQEKIILKKGIRRKLPIFRLYTQDDLDSTLGRRISADFLNLRVQCRLGDLAFFNVFHQPAIPAHEADIQFLLRLVPLAANHDAVPVSIG